MKIRLHLVFVCLLVAAAFNSASAQCVPAPLINFVNPSFEGTPQAHVTPGPWTVCMPGQTPDTQPGSWGVTLPATNGSTYLGLVHDPASGWQEGASEQLSSPFIAGTTYRFTIDLANSSSAQGGIDPGCAELQIWGGFGACDANTLLWNSGNITPFDVWQTYTVVFTPTQNFTWVMLRINSLGCSSQPYILVDNISPIQPANVTATYTAANVTCGGGTNGSAVVHATGQHPPFTYTWNTNLNNTDTTLANVPAGTYTVTITDANTCADTLDVVITQPQPIVLTPTVVPATCFGYSTGSAYMSYSGGVAPFTFTWSNGRTTQNNPNLFAGTYGVTAVDASGCSATANAVITQPDQIIVSLASVDPTCGNSNGSLSASTTSGTGPFTFSWGGGVTGPARSNLSAGTYNVTATNTAGCSASASATLINGGGFTLSMSSTPTSCGLPTGTATATPGGGTPAFTYIWSDGQTTESATNLVAGSYSVTATDAGGCTASATVSVGSSNSLSLSFDQIHTSCGLSNGELTVIPAAGAGPYTYTWGGGQTTATISNLSPGSYDVTVVGAGGCSATGTATINNSSALTVSTSETATTCGLNNGSASVSILTGDGPFDYLWSNGDTTMSPSGLATGSYNVTVTGVARCSATASVSVAPSTGVTISTSTVGTTCGLNNGEASVTLLTGGAPFTYLWSDNSTSATVSGLASGAYTVTVTGGGGCSATATASVASSVGLSLGMSTANTSCGLNNGALTVNVNAGVGPFTYLWSNNETNASISALSAGSYTVTVTGAGGCSATASGSVASSSAVTLNIVSTPTTCGNIDGTVSVSTLTGAGPFSYLWTSGQTTSSLTGLAAGTYDVTVTGTGGCSATASTTVAPSIALTISSSSVTTTCGLNNGEASVTVVTGTAAYSYLWSNGETTSSISTLSAGSYSVTVTDNASCTATASETIGSSVAVTLSTSSTTTTCGLSDGSASVSVLTGIGPYTYLWSNGETSASISNVASGSYDVTVIGDAGCSATASVSVAPSIAVTLTSSAGNAECGVNTGSASVTVLTGTPPYTYLWNTGDFTSSIQNIGTGTYGVIVTDVNNCSASATIDVIVADTTAPTAVCQDISISLVNGVASIVAEDVDGGSYDNCAVVSISATPTEFDCSNIGFNTVTLTATDSAGNSSTCDATVTVTGAPLFSCSITSVLAPSNQITGGNANTIYIGYGPQSTTLTSAINGQGQFTYSWTPSTGLSCTDCASPVFTPNAEGLYDFTLTITNESGCQSSCEITICVLDIRADADCPGEKGSDRGNSPGKVYVCHLPPGNPGNMQLICIGIAGVPAHVPLHGGDNLGRCNQTCGSFKTDETNVPELITDMNGAGFDLLVYPNPFANQFRIQIETESTEPANIRLYNIAGQLIGERRGVEPNTDVYLGENIANGVYFVEVVQNGYKKVIRMNKQQ